jgi:hypothetical protein
MPDDIRNRIRVRRGVATALAVAAGVLLVAIAIGSLRIVGGARPGGTPTPPVLVPTAAGRTQLFRWRVMAASVDGRIETELQTASLAGGGWFTVAERSFDPERTAFADAFRLTGSSVDRHSSDVLVWGFVPSGANRLSFDPGEGCDTIAIGPEEVVTDPEVGFGVWGTALRTVGGKCVGPGNISALRTAGDVLAENGYAAPIASDLWALTTAKRGGVGWVLHRTLGTPTGIAIGDAGIPNDLRRPILGDRLSADVPVAWETTPPASDGTFVFGITLPSVDHVVLVLPGAQIADATMTSLPGDPFDVFWADVPNAEPVQLVVFDAACEIVANESMNGRPVGNPPSGACTPAG